MAVVGFHRIFARASAGISWLSIATRRAYARPPTGRGRQAFHELVRRADVVYDNFRPGVRKRQGLDYDSLKALNRRIICCSVSGYGQTHPYKDQPSFDNIIQAMGA